MNSREKWQSAYENAAFYASVQNSSEYWDKVSEYEGAGLSGAEHVDLLINYLLDNGLIDKNTKVLDIGCGDGDYVLALADKVKSITALDYSSGMINACRKRCKAQSMYNVDYICDDFSEHIFEEIYDLTLAILNPAIYCPSGFEKMLSLTKGHAVYMTMDMKIDAFKNEPVYNGTNSIEYAEEYLREAGIEYEKLPYVYHVKMQDGNERRIPFAFLICKME